jgi:hypothetical protein
MIIGATRTVSTIRRGSTVAPAGSVAGPQSPRRDPKPSSLLSSALAPRFLLRCRDAVLHRAPAVCEHIAA